MIWNCIKALICGTFHRTVFLTEESPYYRGPELMVCAKCGAEFKVLKDLEPGAPEGESGE